MKKKIVKTTDRLKVITFFGGNFSLPFGGKIELWFRWERDLTFCHFICSFGRLGCTYSFQHTSPDPSVEGGE